MVGRKTADERISISSAESRRLFVAGSVCWIVCGLGDAHGIIDGESKLPISSSSQVFLKCGSERAEGKNGGDFVQIKFLLGHSSIQTTERLSRSTFIARSELAGERPSEQVVQLLRPKWEQ
jgi:hypothetical protein